MTHRTWTEAEFQQAVDLHVSGWSAADIGKALGRSDSAVRLKLIARGYSSRAVKRDGSADEPVVETQPKIERAEAERIVEQRDRRLEDRRDQQLAVERVLQDRLIETVRTTLSECLVRTTIRPPLPVDRKQDEMTSAVLLVGDTHVGKVCNPAESEGRADYSPALTLARIHHLEREAIRLIESGPPVEELVLILLGDIIEGALNHHAEREETILVSKQFSLATSLLSQFIARMGAVVPKVKIYGVCGNHGRWPGQRRMPSVGRESNFDRLIYCALESITAAARLDHIVFDLRDASRQLVEVQNTLIQIAHGDELRGGEYCVGGIKREVFNSVLRHGREGRAPDLWITGDKHISLSLPVGEGAFVVNGSMVGEDTYGQKFSPTRPSQTLF